MSPALYLIPVTLGDTPPLQVLPAYNIEVISGISCFIVENVRTARRFIKSILPQADIDAMTFFTLNKHTSPEDITGYLNPLTENKSIGVLSEAGCPGVSDPGADVVAIAQAGNYRVIPLVGPSSILLALMASGFNGQNFAFRGYLPIDPQERSKTLKMLEQKIFVNHQTQLFIETPFRNHKILKDIILHCRPQTKLCIAADITLETEFIKTKSIGEWKKQLPDLNKRPCIFLLYK
ncbi:MAG: SAM-dependent methyltransferase [Candidatus Azobacteroides sp.]|nr:SAM-dependent methyltransferase [Candidatus Azobacteroides sp.]